MLKEFPGYIFDTEEVSVVQRMLDINLNGCFEPVVRITLKNGTCINLKPNKHSSTRQLLKEVALYLGATHV